VFELSGRPAIAQSNAALQDLVRVPSATGPGFLIRTAHKTFSASLAALLSARGVALNHYYYLRALFEEDGITPAELSGRIRMERATVTAVLDTMERQGLVRRVPHQHDRRKVRIFLTPKGEALREPVLSSIAQVNAHALAGIAPAEFARFQRTLFKLTANLAGTADGGLHALD
jgi:MarR family transcriptional regulator, organic hydroperoxide resistance regulator